MNTSFCNLVIVSPGDPRIWKIHITWKAAVILLVAFLVSFCVTVALSYGVAPEKLSSAEHLRLQAENQSLEIANKNAVIRTEKLETELKKLEALFYRISALAASD